VVEVVQKGGEDFVPTAAKFSTRVLGDGQV